MTLKKIEMETIINQIGKLAEALYEEMEQYETKNFALGMTTEGYEALEDKMITVSQIHQLLVTPDEDSLDFLNCMITIQEERIIGNKNRIRKANAEKLARAAYEKTLQEVMGN